MCSYDIIKQLRQELGKIYQIIYLYPSETYQPETVTNCYL